MRAPRPSAAKLPATRPRSSSASSGFPCVWSIRASGTTASARRGSSSIARRKDCSSPRSTRVSASEGTSESRNRSTAGGGWAPTNSASTCPWRKALTAGMPCTRYSLASRWFESTSTFTSSTFPPRAATARSRRGPSWRQGAHHSAQKSTTTGSSRERSMTADWKLVSVTSIGTHGRQPVWASG